MGKNRKRNGNRNSAVLPAVLMALAMALTGCGQRGKNRNEEYGEVIAGLGDDEQFALEDIGENYDVLFTTDMTYEDGAGHHAALRAAVYYVIDGQACSMGRVESMGTAYPVSYGKRCIYTASEHSLQIYEIDTAKQQLSLKAEYEIIFDETDRISYRCTKDGQEEMISEEAYAKIYKEYEKSTVVSFGYGAGV